MFAYASSFCHNVGYYWNLKALKVNKSDMFDGATAYNRGVNITNGIRIDNI